MKPIGISRVAVIFAGVTLVLLTACRPVSFENVDLQPIMFQPEDLPAVLAAGTNGAIDQNDFFNYDIAYQQAISSQSGEEAGEVRVYLFHTAEDRDKMYNFLSLMETPEGIVPYETPSIGEMAIARQDPSQQGRLQINLTFKRCYAIANIWLRTVDDFTLRGNEIVAYAQKIDARLKHIACP
jgi:hypothetical protein